MSATMTMAKPAHRTSQHKGFEDYTMQADRVKVTITKTVPRQSPAQPSNPISYPSRSSSITSSPLSSAPSSPAYSNLSSLVSSKKKRKSPEAGPSKEPLLPRPVKKLRGDSGKKKRGSSRGHSPDERSSPCPEPIYRNKSRSTSVSVTPAPQTRQWATEEAGSPGESHISPEIVVKRLMKSYKTYFHNPEDLQDTSFEPRPTNYPVVELEYPNIDGCERYILLQPKDKDHYNPIFDFEKTFHTIITHYVTPDQRKKYNLGEPPTSDTLLDDRSPSPSSSESSLSPLSGDEEEEAPPKDKSKTLVRKLQSAIHYQDGPLFVKTAHEINKVLRRLKYPVLFDDPFAESPSNSLMAEAKKWEGRDLPEKVLMRILEENYQRCVGPNVQSLRKYEAFTSTVYGELTPSLVHEIIRDTGLTENSLFLDLGSGVGNVVVQASLQTGCRSYGIEMMPAPAKVAREMVEQFRIRCRMWGLRCGEIEVEEGDMLDSRTKVDELIKKADVVLVDNKVFEESLNEALKPKFLDLKEGAIVVSLAPFAPVNVRVTDRNLDDITSAIFTVKEKPYYPGAVSWGNGGGTYYIHTVDRVGYAQVREQFENSRASSRRSSRSRW